MSYSVSNLHGASSVELVYGAVLPSLKLHLPIIVQLSTSEVDIKRKDIGLLRLS